MVVQRSQITWIKRAGKSSRSCRDKAFQIIAAGESHTFDSFECAIQAMAPECSRCWCKVFGHGVESNEDFYCCAYCANMSGVRKVTDRSEET